MAGQTRPSSGLSPCPKRRRFPKSGADFPAKGRDPLKSGTKLPSKTGKHSQSGICRPIERPVPLARDFFTRLRGDRPSSALRHTPKRRRFSRVDAAFRKSGVAYLEIADSSSKVGLDCVMLARFTCQVGGLPPVWEDDFPPKSGRSRTLRYAAKWERHLAKSVIFR